MKPLLGLLHQYIGYVIRTRNYAVKKCGTYIEMDQSNWSSNGAHVLAYLKRRTAESLMAWYLNSINVGYLMPLCLYLLVPKLKVIRLTTRVVCKANTQLGSTLTSLRFALPYVKRGGLYLNFSCF